MLVDTWIGGCRRCRGFGVETVSATTTYPERRICVDCDGRGYVVWRDVDLADEVTASAGESEES
jgi:hypothetical protein